MQLRSSELDPLTFGSAPEPESPSWRSELKLAIWLEVDAGD